MSVECFVAFAAPLACILFWFGAAWWLFVLWMDERQAERDKFHRTLDAWQARRLVEAAKETEQPEENA